MGRSNNTELVNPATRFFDWSGSTGHVVYYDKLEGVNVEVPFPFAFLVLEAVSQITGGIDNGNKYEGFWSNAVMNTKTQPFTVRSASGVVAQGLYEHIKGHPGIKYMRGLYVMFFDENKDPQIGYIRIKGAALTAWIEFTKSHKDIYSGAFSFESAKKCKKGSTVYYEPVFKYHPKVSEESEAAAIDMHKHLLTTYLEPYFAQQAQPMAMAAPSQFTGQFTGSEEPPMPEWDVNDMDEPDSIPF